MGGLARTWGALPERRQRWGWCGSASGAGTCARRIDDKGHGVSEFAFDRIRRTVREGVTTDAQLLRRHHPTFLKSECPLDSEVRWEERCVEESVNRGTSGLEFSPVQRQCYCYRIELACGVLFGEGLITARYEGYKDDMPVLSAVVSTVEGKIGIRKGPDTCPNVRVAGGSRLNVR